MEIIKVKPGQHPVQGAGQRYYSYFEDSTQILFLVTQDVAHDEEIVRLSFSEACWLLKPIEGSRTIPGGVRFNCWELLEASSR